MKHHRAASFSASPNEIADRIARYRASGLGLKAFARKEGVPPGRLHYWVYQKPGEGAAGAPPSKATRTAGAPVFQEVKLSSWSEWNRPWEAEIGLPQGIAVRFSASASAEWIGSVVRALRKPC